VLPVVKTMLIRHLVSQAAAITAVKQNVAAANPGEEAVMSLLTIATGPAHPALALNAASPRPSLRLMIKSKRAPVILPP